jgi:hypothetical protein
MADTKISALPASTTPLAGTEVLPIVQSGATKQVSVANLTAGRAISATTVTASTGNFIVGTAGQGVDFSADPATAGMTSELLDDYEEGAWTPVLGASTSNAGQTYSRQLGKYTKVGRLVTVSWDVIVSDVGTLVGDARLKDLPFAVATGTGSQGFRAGLSLGQFAGLAASVSLFAGIVVEGDTSLYIRSSVLPASSIGDVLATSTWANGTQFTGSISYMTN